MEVKLETRDGTLRGRRDRDLCVFRGIPYARSRRLRAPERPVPWAGVRDALAPGPSAPQTPGPLAALTGATPNGSAEDCLTLDVWTPALDGRRPVLVWLHGGSFTSGSGSLSIYDGSGLARRGDAVVVTLNYRLGILGWWGGNWGLLDQIAALAWVREHAAALGGDPDRVTLFGESAGAMSVGTLLGCPRARGLFARAILQSGAAHHVHAPDEAERVSRAVLELVDPRDAPVDAILAAQQQVLSRGLRFQPMLDGDVLPRLPLDAIADGEAAGVPLLAGSNLDEYRLFGLADRKAASLDEAALLRRCRRNLADRAEGAIETYRARLGSHPPALWFAIESDRHFRVPATRLLDAQRPHASVRSYLFTWASPVPELGSCHTLEIPFVFGRTGDPRLRPFVGTGGEALSARMQDAWLAFARGEEPEDWPVYGAERATAILGPACASAKAPYEAERAFWEGIL